MLFDIQLRSAESGIFLPLFALSFALVSTTAISQDQEWPTYGGDLASTRYSPLEIINAETFAELEVAWEFDTSNFGPIPEFRFHLYLNLFPYHSLYIIVLISKKCKIIISFVKSYNIL